MKDAVKLAIGLVALYVVLTWSYSGFTADPASKFEDSVADRLNKEKRVNTEVAY